MLSFMKDGQDKSNVNVPDESTGIDSSTNPPSGDQSDYLTVGEHGKNLKQSTITLAILFTVGALCLWFMIKKVAPESADAAVSPEETQIELAIAELTGIRSEQSKMGDIVDRFYTFSEVDQINVSELKKNPFSHEIDIANFEESMDLNRGVIAREEVNRKSKSLQLWSIMASDQEGCCMINDKILYIGNVINGFTVTKIDPRYVVLESEGIPVTLKMSE